MTEQLPKFMKLYPEEVRLAEEHVNWFLETIKPLLITHFVHGYKHGMEDKNGNNRA